MEGANVSSHFEKLLGPLEKANDEILDKAFRKKGLDIEPLSKTCNDASKIILLLRLKVFLTEVYNVPDERIHSFLPSDKEKLSDRGVTTTGELLRFDARVTIDNQVKSKKARYRALRKHFLEFQKLMSSEAFAVDYNESGETKHLKRKRKE